MGIDKDKSLSVPAELRRRAEELIKGLKPRDTQLNRTKHETLKLVHELEVHQIELEMQNAELRQTRDELEKALDRYTDLYDFAPVGYFTLDREGSVRAANFTGAGLLGVKRSQMLGRHFGLFVDVEARPLFSEILGKVLASQSKESCEVTLTTEGNSPLILHIDAVADPSGKECRVVAIDITERRRAEDALNKQQQQLEELNSSLESRITQAVDELRRKDQMLILQDRRATMGEMINNIAHQWRQPLNTLGLIIQKIPLFYDSPEFSREFLENNTDKGMKLIQHMSQTIDDFRNFFRSDKEMVNFSINKVIDHTVSLIGKSFLDQQIHIDLRKEGNPMISGYPNEYAQVLLNILLNARDVLVEQIVDDARICVHSFEEGGKTVVTVTDKAGGIADEIIDRLFDPYFTTKGPDKGTGLGLFMSKTIIEKNMGGKLTVRNTESGAEFRIEV